MKLLLDYCHSLGTLLIERQAIENQHLLTSIEFNPEYFELEEIDKIRLMSTLLKTHLRLKQEVDEALELALSPNASSIAWLCAYVVAQQCDEVSLCALMPQLQRFLQGEAAPSSFLLLILIKILLGFICSREDQCSDLAALLYVSIVASVILMLFELPETCIKKISSVLIPAATKDVLNAASVAGVKLNISEDMPRKLIQISNVIEVLHDFRGDSTHPLISEPVYPVYDKNNLSRFQRAVFLQRPKIEAVQTFSVRPFCSDYLRSDFKSRLITDEVKEVQRFKYENKTKSKLAGLSMFSSFKEDEYISNNSESASLRFRGDHP